MKSVPLTARGPVDDDNYSWVKSQPRLYESKGEIGLRSQRHESQRLSSHRRSCTTGSIEHASTASWSRDGRGATFLPKIATGRSAHSAKKLWRDVETIKIKSVIQKELETPRIPPLYMPKYPKPLYKRPVDEMGQFKVLHLREFEERGEVDSHDVSAESTEFYSQITFLRNAVRNIDGTTSYQNLCKKPRSWSEPSPTDNQPGLIKGNNLHWQSASTSIPHPRMLLPLKPGPNTKWYAWRINQASKEGNPQVKLKKAAETSNMSKGDFFDTFSPRDGPHPTPAMFKDAKTVIIKTSPSNVKVNGDDVPMMTSLGANGGTGRSKAVDKESKTQKDADGTTFITEQEGGLTPRSEQRDETNKSSESKLAELEQTDVREVVNSNDEVTGEPGNVDQMKEDGEALKEEMTGEVESAEGGEAEEMHAQKKEHDELKETPAEENGAENAIQSNDTECHADDTAADQEQDIGTNANTGNDEHVISEVEEREEPESVEEGKVSEGEEEVEAESDDEKHDETLADNRDETTEPNDEPADKEDDATKSDDNPADETDQAADTRDPSGDYDDETGEGTDDPVEENAAKEEESDNRDEAGNAE